MQSVEKVLTVKVLDCKRSKVSEFQDFQGFLIAFKVSGALILCHVLDILIAVETVPLLGRNDNQVYVMRQNATVWSCQNYYY